MDFHRPGYACGPQNSRGFRALKVWLALRAAGREGMVQMIADDIGLAKALYVETANHTQLEPLTQGLSITNFRYIPEDLRTGNSGAAYLNQLNEALLDRIQKSGELFLSNAVIGGKFALRFCAVNFRTTLADVEAIPGIVIRLGSQTDAELRGRGVFPAEDGFV